MTPTMNTLPPLCGIGERPPRYGYRGCIETDCQSYFCKVKSTLLQDVFICQESYFDHFVSGKSLMYLGVQDTGKLDQTTAYTVETNLHNTYTASSGTGWVHHTSTAQIVSLNYILYIYNRIWLITNNLCADYQLYLHPQLQISTHLFLYFP